MIVRPKKVRNLIRLEDDFVELVNISKFGEFTYSINIYTNIFEAEPHGNISIRITAYAQSPSVRTPTFHKAISSRDVIEGLKTHHTRMKSRIKKARSEPLASVVFNPPKRREYQFTMRDINTGQTITVDHEEEVSRLVYDNEPDTSVKNAELTIAMPTMASDTSTMSPRRAAIRLVLKDGIDPSSVTDGNFPLQTQMDSRQGLRPGGSKPRIHIQPAQDRYTGANNNRLMKPLYDPPPPIPKMSMFRKPQLESRSLLAHLGEKNITSIRQNVIDRSKILREKVVIEWKSRVIQFRIERDKLRGLKTFYLFFEVFSETPTAPTHRGIPTGRIIDTFTRKVNHDEELSEFLTPKQPPSIRVKRVSPGRNILMVKGAADNMSSVATSVEISRRFIDPKSPTMESKFQIISTVDVIAQEIGVNAAEVRVDDKVNNTRACMYRAVAIGPRGHRNPNFASTISRPLPINVPIPEKKRMVSDPTHVSVFAETVGDLVHVRLTNIPEGPVSTYIVSHDLTTDRKGKTRRVVGQQRVRRRGAEDDDPGINPFVRNISSKTVDIIFEDRNVKHNHVYEYRCVMIYADGREELSKSYEIHEFKKIMGDEKVILSLGKPELRMDEMGAAFVSFDIGARFTDKGIESTLEAMESAGISGVYLEEIKSNRDKFNSLLSFLVIRQESITGETETFGHVGMGRFVDDQATRSSAGVSDILSGRSYRYVIQLMVRDAETLFEGVTAEGIDLETQKKFRKKMSKYFNPKTLSEGTLPSTAASLGIRVGGDSFANKFAIGKTAIFQSLDISVPRQRIDILNLTVSKGRARKNIVQWEISGDDDLIDHFIVIGQYRGIKGPLGRVHHESRGGVYRYFDTRLSFLVGLVSYSIIPVLTNFIYMPESDSVTTTQTGDTPKFMRRS